MRQTFLFLLIGIGTAFVFKAFFRAEHPLNLALCTVVGSASALLGGLVGFWVGRRLHAGWLGFLTAFTFALASLTAYEYVTVDRPHEKHLFGTTGLISPSRFRTTRKSLR